VNFQSNKTAEEVKDRIGKTVAWGLQMMTHQCCSQDHYQIWAKQDLHCDVIYFIKPLNLTGDKQASFGMQALVQVTW